MTPLPSDWRELASGCGFTEGPVGLKDDVYFVSVNRGLLYRAPLDGTGAVVAAEPGAGPNGAAADAKGRLWLAQNGARVMESRSHEAAAGIQLVDGALTLTMSTDAADVDAPNDCAFGPDGRLYFTDPHGRLGESRGDGPTGRVWALDPGTGHMELVANGLHHPNGLCFTAGDDQLWVSDTKTRQILSFTPRLGGGWDQDVVDTVPGGGPDGMAFDSAGSLWVAATDAEGLWVRSAEGDWNFVDLGRSFPTNVAFVGPGLNVVAVTAARGGRLLAADVDIAGLPLHVPRLSV
jgi:gluconolactonase